MGDSLSTLRTRFLDEVLDPNQTEWSTAVSNRLVNEGQRHAAALIRERDPRWPLDEVKIQTGTDVERYPVPDDFEEEILVYRSDVSHNPPSRRVRVQSRSEHKYGGQFLASTIDGKAIPFVEADAHYLEDGYIGFPWVPQDAVRTYVVKFRKRLTDMADDLDLTLVPTGHGTDVICLHAAWAALVRKGLNPVGIEKRLQSASARLQGSFGRWSASENQIRPWVGSATLDDDEGA